MNIVFLIGNGFDLNLGLNTRYSDFYEYYKNQRAKDERPYIRSFLNDLASNEDWSDFDLANMPNLFLKVQVKIT